jgi:hypothetical protein
MLNRRSSAFRLREARPYHFACREALHERSEIPAAILKVQPFQFAKPASFFHGARQINHDGHVQLLHFFAYCRLL